MEATNTKAPLTTQVRKVCAQLGINVYAMWNNKMAKSRTVKFYSRTNVTPAQLAALQATFPGSDVEDCNPEIFIRNLPL